MLRAFLMALAVVFAGLQPANAQEPTPQQYESVMRWAGGHQQIIQMVVGPLQQMPGTVDMENRSTRRAWVQDARAWISYYRAQIQAARAAVQSLGPVPEAGVISEPYRRQANALPDMMDGIDDFIAEYDQGIDAVERNDPRALTIAAMSSNDATILILTQFRNLNALQAESLTDGPQRYLLRAFASSYEAMIVVARERSAAYAGESLSPASSTSVRAAADAMLEHSRIGRARAQQAEAELPAQAPPEQGDFLRRVRQAYQSFAGSFAREEQIAAELRAVADLLGSTNSFAAVEDRIAPHILRAGILDGERLGDIQQRTQLLQTIIPPT